MSRSRWFILAVAPALIVVASLAVSNWLRPVALAEPTTNIVHIAPASPALANGRHAPADERRAHGLEQECRERGVELARKLGDEGRVLVRSPFVIGGDLSDAQLRSWYERTIAPAARAMARTYFDTPPDRPMTVLLFSTEANYEHFARELYGDEGISVFGYYKPVSRTLVMNISTGGGTLVHELTHALMAFDFPDVPDWFNEGLASLHEQCRFLADDAGIEGLVNWRLALLQKTIAAGRLRPIEAMLAGDDFRGELEGVNYAQARYLCMYLQERELLVEFYERFRDARRDDPHGVATLRRVLGNRSWTEINEDFQTWAAGLKAS